MTDDIVARLRDWAECEDDILIEAACADFHVAADEIERLRAALKLAQNLDEPLMNEIERLRAEVDRRDALIRDVVESWDWWQVDTYDRCESVVSDAVRDARAALAGEAADDAAT